MTAKKNEKPCTVKAQGLETMYLSQTIKTKECISQDSDSELHHQAFY